MLGRKGDRQGGPLIISFRPNESNDWTALLQASDNTTHTGLFLRVFYLIAVGMSRELQQVKKCFKNRLPTQSFKDNIQSLNDNTDLWPIHVTFVIAVICQR